MKRPNNIPSLSEIYRSGQAGQAQAASKSDHPSGDWWMHGLPPHDPLRAEAKKRRFNDEPMQKTGA